MRALQAFVVVALFLTSCGSSGPKTTAKPPGPDVARDRASAQAIVIGRLDFPSGWKATPHRESGGDIEFGRKMDYCLGLSAMPNADVVTVYGDDFGRGTAYVGSSVTFVKTAEDATRDLTALRSPKLPACLRQVVGPIFERGGPGSDGRVRSATVAAIKTPRVGQGAVGFRVTITVLAAGGTFKVFADLIFIVMRRAEIMTSFTSAGAPFDEAFRNSLLTKVGRRLGLA